MNKIEQFKQELIKSGEDFIVLSPIPASKVRLRFIGRFNNEEVLWDTIVQTLTSYNSDEERSIISRSPALMQIDPDEDKVYKLKVALSVPVIDIPTIKKTIIMVRGYKRLTLGLHEFGKNL